MYQQKIQSLFKSLNDYNYYELKYAFLIGMVLFVKKMGECLVFITILFVTQLAIVVVGAMNDRTGFAKVSHLLIS